jgi:hypothetical protein
MDDDVRKLVELSLTMEARTRHRFSIINDTDTLDKTFIGQSGFHQIFRVNNILACHGLLSRAALTNVLTVHEGIVASPT